MADMQNEKESIRKRLSGRYTMDAVLGDRELVVLRGQCGVTVYGCRKILSYSPCEICLRVGKRRLSVLGEELCCTCFSAGSVTVEGRIRGVFYETDALRGDNRKGTEK